MSTPLLDDAGRVDWQALERRIPLDELPGFHRAFLNLNRPGEDYSDAFLRQVQGKVQATLKQLVRAGRALERGEATWVEQDAIPEGFRHYLE
jgi:hypothetical protein